MQIESVSRYAIELLKPALGKTPEALNAVDVCRAPSKLIRPVRDSEVFRVADINQSIIAAPTIRMDDRFGRDATTNNGL